MAKRICHCLLLFACMLASSRGVAQQVGSTPTQAPAAVSPFPNSNSSSLVAEPDYLSPFASMFTSSRQPPSSDVDLQSYYRSNSRSQMLDAPEMFGDYRRAGPNLVIEPFSLLPTLETELPVAAGISGLRVAENNQALPADRVWTSYSHFSNAFEVRNESASSDGPPSIRTQSLDRSVIAIEKLLDDGRTSLEIRMPFGAAFNIADDIDLGEGSTSFGLESKSLGNLNLLLKRLLFADQGRAFSAGVGVELPTGSTTTISYDVLSASLNAEAVHFTPFVAYTESYRRWFGHCFAQVDIAAGGDTFRATLESSDRAFAGKIDQPVLVGLDAGLGYWVIPLHAGGRGLAFISEIHSTIPLGDDADDVAIDGLLGTFAINQPSPNYEVVHSTFALHAALGNGWAIRSGVVFPLRDERAFQAEYMLQINRGR